MLSEEEVTRHDERQTPFEPLRKAIAEYKEAHPDEGSRKKLAVLIGTGSMNPVHRMHLTMFDIAASYLERHANIHALVAYLSPSCDDYVNHKLGMDAIPSIHRLKMCRLAAEEHNKSETAQVPVYVDSWEADQPFFIDFPSVRRRLEMVVQKQLPDEGIEVLFVCGADLYLRCRLVNMRNVVAVARPPYKFEGQESKQPNNFVADTATDEQLRDLVSDCSSTEIRKRLAEGAPTDDLTYPSVAKYLQEIEENKSFPLEIADSSIGTGDSSIIGYSGTSAGGLGTGGGNLWSWLCTC